MKIVNIILCVLILLLGIISAVFSYFLFEKRSQFVTGWAKMADTVNKTAAALDQNSGTKIAAKLTSQALAHENYSNIDTLLPELPKLGSQIITERDALADALARISRSIQQPEKVELAKLQDLNTYSPQKDTVVKGVIQMINNRDKSYRNLANVFDSQLKINIDRKQLLDGDSAAFDEFKKELSKRNNRKNIYESRFREIAGLLRASSPNFSEDKYDASLRKIVADIRTYRDKANTTANDLRQAKSEIDRQQRTIAGMKKSEQRMQKLVADKNTEIVHLKRALGFVDVAEAQKPWEPGSAEARANFAGKVTVVNSKYGYLAMNIGKYSVVQQQIGNSRLEINPLIEPRMECVITRPDGKGKKFIARIKVNRVGDSFSVANIPPEAEEIRVNDDVSIAPVAAATKAEPDKKGKAVKKTTAKK